MKPFKIRCSAIGRVMTDGRGSVITEKQLFELQELQTKGSTKGLTEIQRGRMTELIAKRDAPPELSDTAKQYVLERYIAHKYGRTKDISNRFITKGLMVEEASITLITRLFFKLHKEVFVKNEEYFQNEWITGTPDLFANKRKRVIDAKSSWDIFTFFDAKKSLNPIYEWQVQGYMDLTDADDAMVSFCLVDTPEELIEQEINRLRFKIGNKESDDFEETANQLRRSMNYSDIPLNERIHSWSVQRDDNKIKAIHDRQLMCQDYFNSLL